MWIRTVAKTILTTISLQIELIKMIILHENIRQDKMTNTIFIVDGHLRNEVIKTIIGFLEKSQFSYFKYGKYI